MEQTSVYVDGNIKDAARGAEESDVSLLRVAEKAWFEPAAQGRSSRSCRCESLHQILLQGSHRLCACQAQPAQPKFKSPYGSKSP